MRNNTLIWISALLSLLILSVLYLDHKGYFKPSESLIRSDTVVTTKTDTIYKTDTFKIVKLQPKEVVKLKTDTVFTSDGDTLRLVTESKRYDESIVNDGDTADISVFTSGINAQVDSLRLKLNRRVISTTNTIEVTRVIEKNKRFHIAPQVGVGYGVFNKSLDCYVGFGISVDL